MYWKDELDALYQKNKYGKRLWNEMVGSQAELLLRNNLRYIVTILELEDTKEGMQLHFEASTSAENTKWILNHREIKFIDPYLK